MHSVETVDGGDLDTLRACFPIFKVLRPHLDEAEFLHRVQTQTVEGYRVVMIRVDGTVAAAAGFRVLHFLWARRVLYIDDLITDPTRRKLGLGGTLLDWLINEGA